MQPTKFSMKFELSLTTWAITATIISRIFLENSYEMHPNEGDLYYNLLNVQIQHKII